MKGCRPRALRRAPSVLVVSALLGGCSTYDYYSPMENLTGAPGYDPSGASQQLHVAGVAMQVDRDPAVNRQTMQDFVEQITQDHPAVDLIAFGEMSLGWYDDPDDQATYQEGVAETIPGPTANLVSQLARSYHVAITFGMVQEQDGLLYDAQPIIDPDGTILAVHHKTYLTPSDKEAGFVPGNDLTVVDIDGVRTGVAICKDQENSLLTAEAADQGCRLVVLSLADDVVEDISDFGTALSQKYHAWLLEPNRYGQEGDVSYQGEIRVSDPAGNPRASNQGGEAYIYYTIPLYE